MHIFEGFKILQSDGFNFMGCSPVILVLLFTSPGFFIVACAARSVRMRSRRTVAGSSLGSCGTSWPEKAARRMFGVDLEWLFEGYLDCLCLFLSS